MKKLIYIMAILMVAIMSSMVIAEDFKKYDGGMIVTPFPVGVIVEVSDLNMPGVLVTVCNTRTGYCEDTTTNKEGYAQFELGNFEVPETGTNSWLPPWLPGDEITAKACDNADKCLQRFTINARGVAEHPPAILHYYLSTNLVIAPDVDMQLPSEKDEGQIIIQDEDVAVEQFENLTDVKDVEDGLAWYWWFSGFIALCAFWYSGFKLRGSQMWETFLRKHKFGEYRRR